MNDTISIAPLTKATLELAVISDDAGALPSSDPVHFSFICGLAIEGLTAFEKEIQGMAPGDLIRLSMEARSMISFFEHLADPILDVVQAKPPFELSVRVVSIEPVTDRELVKALAEKTERSGSDCGCGCSCDCG